MKALRKILFGFVVAALVFAALGYHFILTSERLVVERKDSLTFSQTFVDTRNWGPLDYVKHPDISAILLKHGIKRGLGDAGGGLEDAKKRLKEKLE